LDFFDFRDLDFFDFRDLDFFDFRDLDFFDFRDLDFLLFFGDLDFFGERLRLGAGEDDSDVEAVDLAFF
jgi:hypothetical protein